MQAPPRWGSHGSTLLSGDATKERAAAAAASRLLASVGLFLQVVARKERPLLELLPRCLTFKAVRPGEAAVLE